MKMKSFLAAIVFIAAPFCVQATIIESAVVDASSGLRSMTEGELSAVDAQGLFWTDKIGGNELAGANNYSVPFTFYRMGLDGDLELNLNMSKLQLGCGGVNDFISASTGCDIDIDYGSLMGKNASTLDVGNPGSTFKLERPYIEFAIKNDNNPVQREIVGIKIGAAKADGAIVAGRRYLNNQVNQENMQQSTCSTAGATGAGVLACHSGINSVSGFLGAELSINMHVQGTILLLASLNADGCAGRTFGTAALDGDAAACGNSRNNALFVDLGGTRMQSLGLKAAKLNITNPEVAFLGLGCSIFNPLACGVDAIADAVLNEAYASLKVDLRLAHKLIFDNTSDFFLAFQREPVAYPRYSKSSPVAEMTANGTIGTAFDSCAVAAYSTARCNSAYSVAANTGWWLNAPSVKLLNVYNPNADLGDITTGVASLLAVPGYLIDQAELNLTPAKNCYGTSRFC